MKPTPPSLALGRVPDKAFLRRFFPQRVTLPLGETNNHVHLLGVSGSGKSRLLCNYYLGLVDAGIGVTLIDPHGDLAELILRHLAKRNNKRTLEHLIYLDIARAHQRARYLPFNVLKQPGDRTRIAENVREAFHRAWPSLANGAAPRFDKLVLNGVKALSAANERLPELSWFLTDREFRARVLASETDSRVLRHWRTWYDRLPERLQAEYADSTLSRVDLLSFDEVLRYSLGAEALALNFREVMDRGECVLVNLAGLSDETQRLLGSLMTVMYEQAAKSRADSEERRSHVLMIDEVARFTTKSGEAFQTMLSETRKYGLHLVMSHQNWGQMETRLRSAMSNCRLKIVFQLDREDAELTAKSFTAVDPRTLHTREEAVGVSVSVADQLERMTQAIMRMPPRHAKVKLPDHTIVDIVTEDVPDPEVDTRDIEREQLEKWFKPPLVVPEPPPIIKRLRVA